MASGIFFAILCAFTAWFTLERNSEGTKEEETLGTRKRILSRQYKQLISSFPSWRTVRGCLHACTVGFNEQTDLKQVELD